MARPAQTARSERTRDALRQAALVRFLAQGVEATSAEQIAGDAGVSLRTFYRHFASKQDLLFADYDAGLQWFRTALAGRPAGESILESVQAAIFAFPHDGDAMPKIAALRADGLEPDRIVAHTRQVEADFADAVEVRLTRTHGRAFDQVPDGKLRITVAAKCIAAAVFGGMEVWMVGEDRSLDELARLCRTGLSSLESGVLGPLVSS